MGALRGQNQILSCGLSVILSPPKPLDQIQPNLVCELLPLMRCATATAKKILAPPPGALGRGQKVKYHLISITKPISKIFTPNFVCILTNERYKTYQKEFLFCHLGLCPEGGTWRYLEAKIKFCVAVCPLYYLLLNHWTKFNQI